MTTRFPFPKLLLSFVILAFAMGGIFYFVSAQTVPPLELVAPRPTPQPAPQRVGSVRIDLADAAARGIRPSELLNQFSPTDVVNLTVTVGNQVIRENTEVPVAVAQGVLDLGIPATVDFFNSPVQTTLSIVPGISSYPLNIDSLLLDSNQNLPDITQQGIDLLLEHVFNMNQSGATIRGRDPLTGDLIEIVLTGSSPDRPPEIDTFTRQTRLPDGQIEITQTNYSRSQPDTRTVTLADTSSGNFSRSVYDITNPSRPPVLIETTSIVSVSNVPNVTSYTMLYDFRYGVLIDSIVGPDLTLHTFQFPDHTTLQVVQQLSSSISPPSFNLPQFPFSGARTSLPAILDPPFSFAIIDNSGTITTGSSHSVVDLHRLAGFFSTQRYAPLADLPLRLQIPPNPPVALLPPPFLISLPAPSPIRDNVTGNVIRQNLTIDVDPETIGAHPNTTVNDPIDCHRCDDVRGLFQIDTFQDRDTQN